VLAVRYTVSNLADDLDTCGLEDLMACMDRCVEDIDRTLEKANRAPGLLEEAFRRAFVRAN
jgi:hypothetical protein